MIIDSEKKAAYSKEGLDLLFVCIINENTKRTMQLTDIVKKIHPLLTKQVNKIIQTVQFPKEVVMKLIELDQENFEIDDEKFIDNFLYLAIEVSEKECRFWDNEFAQKLYNEEKANHSKLKN